MRVTVKNYRRTGAAFKATNQLQGNFKKPQLFLKQVANPEVFERSNAARHLPYIFWKIQKKNDVVCEHLFRF